MTMKQVAEYYEVDYDAIWWHYRNNKDELESDGAKKHSIRESSG